jgi:hypothetical protein
LLVALTVTAGALGGCSDTGGRDSVRAYIKQANAAQTRSTPAFRSAAKAYVRYSRGKLSPARAPAVLATAERSIRDARGRLASLDPPPDATELHRRLLRVFDLNAGLAHETALLARYQPDFVASLRPLASAGQRLRDRLRGSSDPKAQARVFGGYASAIERVLRKLRALQPPPLFESAHGAELKRLGASRSLSLSLATAIRAQDSKRVARLLKRFRRVSASRGAGGLPRGSLAAYSDRLAAISAAQEDVRREQVRLNKKFR